jgi:hypothetical protein
VKGKGNETPVNWAEIMEVINGLSPEHQLLELIDEAFAGRSNPRVGKASNPCFWLVVLVKAEREVTWF